MQLIKQRDDAVKSQLSVLDDLIGSTDTTRGDGEPCPICEESMSIVGDDANQNVQTVCPQGHVWSESTSEYHQAAHKIDHV